MRLHHVTAILAAGSAWAATPTALFRDSNSRPVAFAAAEIRRAHAAGAVALSEHGLDAARLVQAPLRIILAAGPEQCRGLAAMFGAPAHSSPQAYSIRRREGAGAVSIAVLGADAAGAMYGGLDLAEAIRMGTLAQVRDSDHRPHLDKRGIKFNIPLDVRTPSYSDNSDQAQKNIPEMWSFDFWREFLDEMARHRYNVLSLWNLHPFPSLVKVPEFPEVALADVLRTRVPMDETYTLDGGDMFRPSLMAQVETVKKMSIEQKIQFWRDVMQYAQDRGIEVYWFTWNIFAWGAEGKHGITRAQDNPRTIEYFRASIREMVLTYPLLAGFGITAGEVMENRKDEFSKEKWLWKAYGEGVRDAVKLQPGRDVRMIHRYHQTAHGEILDVWKDYPGTFDLSFKYAIAHMYSIPNPPFLAPALPYLSPKLRTWLTVRDDDYYSFRWGDPEYAREFIRNIPGPDKIAGFYMGPDGTIWGREFMSTEPETPRELIIGKRWYGFMLWGRLSYQPDLPDALFERALAVRFPQVEPAKLARAWSAASKVFPHITRFFWGDIDLRWFPEACTSHPRNRGFYTVKDFIEKDPMPGSGVLGIVPWRARKLAGKAMDGTTPLEVADALEKFSKAALSGAADLALKQGSNKELRLTLGDITAMGHLGNYYAAKIRGAAALALFDKSGAAPEREEAVKHLQAAFLHWKRYASAYTLQYEQPKLYNRVGWIDIPGLAVRVEQDIAIARLWVPGTVPDTAGAVRRADTPFKK